MASHSERLPQPGSIIASSLTSPLDALYLAAIFDPIFTTSYPFTRLVEPISLFTALLRTFPEPLLVPPVGTKLVDLPTLLAANPQRAVVVFPECTTTNGRGILPFSPSLLSASPKTKIYPISLRYTPADITTPVPKSYSTFLWNLLSKPTHCIRVRIAESVHNTSASHHGHSGNVLNSLYNDVASSSSETLLESEDGDNMTTAEKKVLDKIAEALARLGRVKRVGLGVKEKAEFVKMWTKHRRH